MLFNVDNKRNLALEVNNTKAIDGFMLEILELAKLRMLHKENTIEWKKNISVPIYQNKHDIQCCNNYRELNL